MKRHVDSPERVYALLVEANPVTDEEPTVRPHLAVVEPRRTEMDMPPMPEKRSTRIRTMGIAAVILAVVATTAVLLMNDGGDQSPIATTPIDGTDTTVAPTPTSTTEASTTTVASALSPDQEAMVERYVGVWNSGDPDEFRSLFDPALTYELRVRDGSLITFDVDDIVRDMATRTIFGDTVQTEDCEVRFDGAASCRFLHQDDLRRALGEDPYAQIVSFATRNDLITAFNETEVPLEALFVRREFADWMDDDPGFDWILDFYDRWLDTDTARAAVGYIEEYAASS